LHAAGSILYNQQSWWKVYIARGKTANLKGRAEMLWEVTREPGHGDGGQTHYGIDE